MPYNRKCSMLVIAIAFFAIGVFTLIWVSNPQYNRLREPHAQGGNPFDTTGEFEMLVDSSGDSSSVTYTFPEEDSIHYFHFDSGPHRSLSIKDIKGTTINMHGKTLYNHVDPKVFGTDTIIIDSFLWGPNNTWRHRTAPILWFPGHYDGAGYTLRDSKMTLFDGTRIDLDTFSKAQLDSLITSLLEHAAKLEHEIDSINRDDIRTIKYTDTVWDFHRDSIFNVEWFAVGKDAGGIQVWKAGPIDRARDDFQMVGYFKIMLIHTYLAPHMKLYYKHIKESEWTSIRTQYDEHDQIVGTFIDYTNTLLFYKQYSSYTIHTL